MDASRGSRKAFLLVVMVFVLGIALGTVGTYIFSERVHAAKPQAVHNTGRTMAILTRDLDLNADQQKQIQAIFGETRARYAAIHEHADPEYEQARQQGRERIRQILSPDQRPKFDALMHTMDEERLRRQREEH